MNKDFSDKAWEEYQFLILNDKKLLKKLNNLIKEIERNPEDGLGKPEALKGDLQGYFSRRIDEKNRLVYKIENEVIKIIQCMNHYDDK